ncbi:MAG: hypothetical protein R3F37_08365 [Candidatus Competibacteraceae bacterium]
MPPWRHQFRNRPKRHRWWAPGGGDVPPPAEPGGDGEYRAGDFHNHTTCSDGSTSVRTLTREALARHDWFIHVGHSGAACATAGCPTFFTRLKVAVLGLDCGPTP